MRLDLRRKVSVPILRNEAVFSIARNITAFLKLKVGITRSGVPDREHDGSARLHRQLERKDRELAKLRARLVGGGVSGVNPKNIVWIFGFGRSGSTWLSNMMEDIENHTVWAEPLVGLLFGEFYYMGTGSHRAQQERADFILGPDKEIRRRLVRSLFLERARAGFPELSHDDILVVKEPNGSMGAPLLMEAFPESRMILLIRDPRDVMSSFLDAWSKEGWGRKFLGEDSLPEFDAKAWAHTYRRHTAKARQAYKAHKGRKTLIKYEDLLSDTLGTMKHVYSSLGMPRSEEELAHIVEKHSWKNIPDDEKGKGKFFRKAAPGSWREDLTPEQIEAVEKVSAPILDEFYSRD